MKSLTRQWVRKAEADYAVIEKLLKGKPAINDAVCFHCQQAAEKYLKAYLQECSLAILRTHDLIDLLMILLPVDPSLKTIRRSARSLTQFAVDFRYPGIWASARQAQMALRHCNAIRAAIRERLGLHDR
jgi:HEPN domain-containing protein